MELKGKKVEALLLDTTDHIPSWALRREYRVTYRDSLHHSEEMLKGNMHVYRPGKRDSTWVTISEGMQETLEVDVGDSLIFDIQGVPLRATISGVRKVDWPKDPPNFIFVFPHGVIDKAHKFGWLQHGLPKKGITNFSRDWFWDFPMFLSWT